MVVQAQEELCKGSAMPTDPHHTPIITQPSSSQPQRKQKSRRSKRKDIENTKTAQAQEITSLKVRVKKLEKKGGSRTHKLKRLYKGRKIHDIDADEDITLENVHVAEMFDVNDLHGDEVFVEKEVPIKEVSVVGKVNTASIATTISAAIITEDEITLAQALAELKSVKPKVTIATTATTKGILLQEPSESITRVKNMAGWKPKDLKSKSFANIQELVDKAFKRVNTFVDFRTELVEGTEMEESSKKAKLEQENVKKQKVDDDQEAAKIKELMKIIPDEEEVAVDAIPLATKPPSIVDWKILKEGKISYYQIIRADGSSKRYSPFIQMLRSFDREDLETLLKLVKAKHGYTRPKEGYKRVLWGDPKTMFEHHVEDLVWRNLQGNKVLVWKLFDSWGGATPIVDNRGDIGMFNKWSNGDIQVFLAMTNNLNPWEQQLI
ncbi:hypothetical protein Tco_0618675 [Tanacetum coccineum]